MKTISTSISCIILAVALLAFSCTKNADATANESFETAAVASKEVKSSNMPATLKLTKGGGFDEMLLPNAKEQFGTATTIAVIGLSYEVGNDAKFTTLEYQTDKGVKSYAMHVVVGKQPIYAAGVVLQARKEYTVDCYGNCDCRERWYPSTGAIECTCSSCVMKVTQISREL